MLRTVSLPHAVKPLVRDRQPDPGALLAERLRAHSAHIAVMGLGYAGLPMAIEFAKTGFHVTGLDINEERVCQINAGRSPVSDVADGDVDFLVAEGRLRATSRLNSLAEADVVFVCVPTRLTHERKPDLRHIRSAANSIADSLHSGMLIVLQSTCPPGTTRRVLLPNLEARSGLRAGEDFFVAFAPERIDPGNTRFNLRNTPKLVGGVTPRCGELGVLLFEPIAEQIVSVSSPEVAEMAKLVENSFRFINISFVNELALVCDRMGVSVWEVVEAAATKPFAFLPHYPGPGVGGECIPIVPFHLEAAAQEYGIVAEFIEVAGRVNDQMPSFVVEKAARLLGERGISLDDARILVLGVAYKPNVSDTRESPALKVLELLREHSASVEYYDPHVPVTRCGSAIVKSLTEEELAEKKFDCAVLLTPHAGVDYATIARRVALVLDTRAHLPVSDGLPVVWL